MSTGVGFVGVVGLMLLVAGAPLMAQAGDAMAAAEAVTQCDKLAAYPFDKAKPAYIAGVTFDDIDGSAAKAACEKAIALQPSPRIHSQLGRVLEFLGDPASARVHYEIAVKAGYLWAFTQMGNSYNTDEAENPEGHIAFSWYQRGAELGEPTAMFNVATCLYRGHCAEENVELALVWYKKSAAAGYRDAEDWVEILTEELAE